MQKMNRHEKGQSINHHRAEYAKLRDILITEFGLNADVVAGLVKMRIEDLISAADWFYAPQPFEYVEAIRDLMVEQILATQEARYEMLISWHKPVGNTGAPHFEWRFFDAHRQKLADAGVDLTFSADNLRKPAPIY